VGRLTGAALALLAVLWGVAPAAAETGLLYVTADRPCEVWLRVSGQGSFRRVAASTPAVLEVDVDQAYDVRVAGRASFFQVYRGEQVKVTAGETLAIPTTPEVDWPRVAGVGAVLAGLGALAAWQGKRRLRRLQEELIQAEKRLRQARSRSGDPQQVGRYRVLRRLGKGGMATVYAVEDDFGDRYALKLPEEMSPRFAREYEVLRGLRHPGVVRLYDFSPGGEDEPAYLVMELVPGPTLARVLEERGRLGLDEARSVARSLLEVLAYTHGQKVIHRDLKPANIFLVGPGKVKVVDFGLSRVQGLVALTRTDDVTGTPLYMAPEQVGGKEATPATDVYAVGLILYEMLAGRRPWLEDNTYRLLAARRAGPPEDPAGLNPALPGELSRLILRMLDPDPDRRPSAREALEELG
jgi:hypothetical protein